MLSPISNLNAVQISQVASADSLDDATKMNLLDKIIDWFKGGVQYNALKRLFDKITGVKEQAGSSQQKDFYAEKDRMETFAALRNLALPEHRDQFKFQLVRSKEKETFECTIRIGNVDVYKNDNILGRSDSPERFELVLGRCGMDLEDACRRDDSESIFALLKEISDEMLEMASMPDDDNVDVRDEEYDLVDHGDARSDVTTQSKEVADAQFTGQGGTEEEASGNVTQKSANENQTEAETTLQKLPEAVKLALQPLSEETQTMLLSKLTGELGSSVELHSAGNEGAKWLLSELTETLSVRMGALSKDVAAKQNESRFMFVSGPILV